MSCEQENEFVHTVLDELENCIQRDNQKSVVLFPALPNRLRYLIHKTTENYPSLATFSVGEGWCRRVVVCFQQLGVDLEEYSDSESNSSLYEEPYRRGVGADSKLSMQPRPTRTSSRNQGAKRPDKAIYVPRAARERLPLSPPDSPLTTIDVGLPNLGPSGSTQSVTSASSLCASSETTEGTLSCAPNQNTATDSFAESTASNSDQLLGEQKNMFVQLNGANSSPWPPALDHVVSYFMAVTLEDSEEEMHGQENPIDDRQELNISEIPAKTTEDASSFFEEIMVHLKDTNVSIEHAHNDYSCYETLWINQEDFSHVIEIYDFPPMFKTEDLQDAFTEYSTGGMKIKWVDDTHALGVFSSQSAASHALSLRHPLLKTRTLSEGSRKSKCKAVRRAEFIQPVKERPRTDSAVARRMVTRALGLQKTEARVQRY